MQKVTVKYHDGDSMVISISGTPSKIVEYFLGSVRTFEKFNNDGNEIAHKKLCTEVQFHSDSEEPLCILTEKQARLAAFHSRDKDLILHYLCLEKTVGVEYWNRITENMSGSQAGEVLKSVLLNTWNYQLESDDFLV